MLTFSSYVEFIKIKQKLTLSHKVSSKLSILTAWMIFLSTVLKLQPKRSWMHIFTSWDIRVTTRARFSIDLGKYSLFPGIFFLEFKCFHPLLIYRLFNKTRVLPVHVLELKNIGPLCLFIYKGHQKWLWKNFYLFVQRANLDIKIESVFCWNRPWNWFINTQYYPYRSLRVLFSKYKDTAGTEPYTQETLMLPARVGT